MGRPPEAGRELCRAVGFNSLGGALGERPERPTKGLISDLRERGWSRIAGVGAKRAVGRQAETSQRAVRRGLEFLGRYGVSPLEWEAGEFSAPAWGKSFPQSESEEVD